MADTAVPQDADTAAEQETDPLAETMPEGLEDDDLDLELDDDEPVMIDEDEDEGDYDPRVESLQKRLRQAEKKAEYEKRERVKAKMPSWVDEARKHYPCSNPESIKADSRRAFLREAQKQHRANEPLIRKLVAEREELIRQEALGDKRAADAKDQARADWEGVNPGSAGPADVPAEVNDTPTLAEQGRDFGAFVAAKYAGIENMIPKPSHPEFMPGPVPEGGE